MLVAREMTVYKYSIIIFGDRSSPAAAFFCGRSGRACQATIWQEIYFKLRNYQGERTDTLSFSSGVWGFSIANQRVGATGISPPAADLQSHFYEALRVEMINAEKKPTA